MIFASTYQINAVELIGHQTKSLKTLILEFYDDNSNPKITNERMMFQSFEEIII